MKRWQADILLGFAGLIWGFGFVAQKDAFDQIGPLTFVACRFLVSALFVLPFAYRENKGRRFTLAIGRGGSAKIVGLCTSMVGAVCFQQIGMSTSVTNAAFITGVYIVLVPFASWLLYKQKLALPAVIASLVSFAGVGFLTGIDPRSMVSSFSRGDGFILLCAVCFSLQVPILGHLVSALKKPFTLSLLQFLATGIVASVLAMYFETIDLQAIAGAWLPILYAGIAAGGIAYTLQAVAQQHTGAVDSAILMSSETLFGAIGGIWLLHETMSMSGYIGAAMIVASIFIVELVPIVQKRKSRA